MRCGSNSHVFSSLIYCFSRFACVTQNHNYAIQTARTVGCKIVGIGAEDLRDGVVHLVFGLLWQVIKQGLLAKVNVDEHPELLELGLEADELAKLSAAHPEELLLRWVNFHLRNAGSELQMTNFTSDVQDSAIYTTLLHHFAPDECSMDILNDSDLRKRAEGVLDAAELLNWYVRDGTRLRKAIYFFYMFLSLTTFGAVIMAVCAVETSLLLQPQVSLAGRYRLGQLQAEHGVCCQSL